MRISDWSSDVCSSDLYDRIVSVGMLEHVGPRHYREYYRKVASLLKPDGVAVIHAIGVFRSPQAQNPWMEKYIFPGAYTPSLSQQTTAIERHTDLFVTDVEILRTHYADTLLAWRRRCAAARDRIVAMYDRSEEHTSELQSLMRSSYAVF